MGKQDAFLGQDNEQFATPPASGAVDSNAPQGWSVCAQAMRDHDEAMVKDHKEDLDTTLVFTGLLSAVITAFLVESYPKLEEDDTESMTRLLLEAAIRIGDATMVSGGPSLQSLRPPPFKVTTTTIRINVYWFLALVLSLATALLALLVKQWLRHYMSWARVTHPRDGVTLRQFRFDAMDRWQVFRVIGLLPLLIQAAVILFLVGVVDLLWSLHTGIAIVITIVVVVSLLLAVGSVILPSFATTCPYRSPLAWTISLLWSWLIKFATRLRDVLLELGVKERSNNQDEEQSIYFETWQEKDLHQLERLYTSSRYERRSLAWAFRRFQDNQRLDALTYCLGDIARREDMVRCLFDVLARDLQRPPALLREDARGAWLSGAKYEQRGGRNRYIIRRHFHMTLVVLEGLAQTGLAQPAELEQMFDVLGVLRFINVPNFLIDSNSAIVLRLIQSLFSILTRRLELRPNPLVDNVLQVAAECLHELCRRRFDDEQAGFRSSGLWFSSTETGQLLHNAVYMYHSPRAAMRRLKGDTQLDRLFMLSTSIALYSLAQSHNPLNASETAFGFYELARLLEEPIVQCTAERRQDWLIFGWCHALCALADRDSTLISIPLLRAVATWARRNGDSRQAGIMARFVARDEQRDDATSAMSSVDQHESLATLTYAAHTRVHRVRGPLVEPEPWVGLVRLP